MLDGENAVIAGKTERGDKISPVSLGVAVADSAEYPRTVKLVAVMLGVKNAVTRSVIAVNLGVLRMNVIDRSGKLSYRGNRLDPLPDKVRRVEVCAYGVADGGAQFFSIVSGL